MSTQINIERDGVETIVMKPYAVVPWTNGTYALVDMVQYRRGDDTACVMELTDAAALETIMHRLNTKHMKALTTDLRSVERVTLDEGTMIMLTRLGESVRDTLEEALKRTSLTPEKREQALDYQRQMSTPSAVVTGLINKVYHAALMQGSVKP